MATATLGALIVRPPVLLQLSDLRKLAAFYDSYEPKRLGHVSDGQRRNWRKAIRSFLRFVGPQVTIGELTQQTVEEFDEWLHDRKLSLQTVMYYGSIVRNVLHAAAPDRFKTRAMLRDPFPSNSEKADGSLLHFLHTVYVPARLGGISDGYIAHMELVIRAIDRWAGRTIKVSELSDELVTAFLNHLAPRRAPSTLNSMMGVLKSIWNEAWHHRLIKRRPRLRKIRIGKRLPAAWSMDQLRILLQASRDSEGWVSGIPAGAWWYALVRFLYHTGLRIGAVRQLRTTDIDLQTGVLRVPAEFQKQKVEQTFKLEGETLKSLCEIQRWPRTLLFPWNSTKRMLYANYRAILVRAGLPVTKRDYFHRLRRTHATFLAAKLGKALASQSLGHSCLSVTDRYIDPTLMPFRSPCEDLPDPGRITPTERERKRHDYTPPLTGRVREILRQESIDHYDLLEVVSYLESIGVRRPVIAERLDYSYGHLAHCLGGRIRRMEKLQSMLCKMFGLPMPTL
jgi:integrase